MATPFFWGPWTFVVDGGFYLAAGSEKVMSWTGNWIGDHVVTRSPCRFILKAQASTARSRSSLPPS